MLLKEDINAEGFQISDRLQQSNRIPGKAGYGFGDDHIDLPGLAIGHELDEALSGILGAGLGLVRIHTDILPAGMILDQAAVIACADREWCIAFFAEDTRAYAATLVSLGMAAFVNVTCFTSLAIICLRCIKVWVLYISL